MLRTWRQRMGLATGFTFIALIAVIGISAVQPPKLGATTKESTKGSHKQSRAIRVSDDAQSVTLKTFVLSPERELWLSCQSAESKSIQVRSGEGELIREIELPFAAQAINFSSEGVPFIAGDGKIARLSKTGEVEKVIDAPNLLSEEEMKAKVAASNKKMLDQVMNGQDTQLERLKEQVAKLEEDLKQDSVQENERVKSRTETRLTILKQQLESQQDSYDALKKTYESMFSSDADTSRYKRSTGIAVAKQDVFVSLPSLEGHGYAVYRLTHDLTDAQLIVDELHGCCGQLDIQTDGTQLIVAENSAFKVRYFDRDGKETHSFGERGNVRATAATPTGSGWGSCCNPMNVRCAANNELLVAESSIGHIKRYTHDGEFLGLVGTAKIAGGCKHVAIAHDLESDWYYMMNTSANNVLVLVPNDQAPTETEDERESRMAMEGLGQKLLGSWRAVPKSNARPASEEVQIVATIVNDDDADLEEELSEINSAEPTADDEVADEQSSESEAENVEVTTSTEFNYGDYILTQNRYLNFEKDGKLSRQEPQVVATAKPAESTGSFLGAVASIFLGVSSESSPMIEEQPAAWIAIRQQGDSLQVGVLEDEVLNYVAAVRFIDDDHAEFKWYYGEVGGSPLGQCTYERVAQAASCESATCKGDKCDVPGCVHDAKGTTEDAVEAASEPASTEGAE